MYNVNMGKGFFAPFLLVGLMIILVVGYYLINHQRNPIVSPKLEVVQSEKNYTNQNLGFQFKYDKDLNLKEDTEDDFNKRGNGDFRKNFKGYVGYQPGKFLGAVVVLGEDNSYETNPFVVWVFDNPNNLSIDAWYKNYWYYPFVWGDFTYAGKVTLSPKNEATISGQMGKSGVIDYSPGKPKFVYVSKDKKMYLFRIIGDAQNSPADKILATVKFTN